MCYHVLYDCWRYSYYIGMHEDGIAKALGCMQCIVSVGMRVLSPSMNRWPGWMDIFPNITLLPKVEAKTLIMHVSPCTAMLIVDPLASAPDASLTYDLHASLTYDLHASLTYDLHASLTCDLHALLTCDLHASNTGMPVKEGLFCHQGQLEVC